MAITPADIEKKTFSTALRGYDLDEVDDFLDEMVVAVRELEEELATARQRVSELEGDPQAVATAAEAAQAAVPVPDESAVGRALVAAQQAADRMLDDARGEADKIVADARSEADTFAQARDAKKAEVDAEMSQMTELVAGVRTKLAVLATTVADKLDEMDAAVGGAHGMSAAKPAATMEGDDSDGGDSDDGEVEATVIEDFTDDGPDGADDGEVEEPGEETGPAVDLEADEGTDEEGAGSVEIEGLDEAGREGEDQGV